MLLIVDRNNDIQDRVSSSNVRVVVGLRLGNYVDLLILVYRCISDVFVIL